MPTSAETRPVLVDTSAAVAIVLEDHEHHTDAVRALGGRAAGLAGHAAFETFSVLTRLPPPARRTPAAVAALFADNFPHTRYASAEGSRELLELLPGLLIAGGAVYDALVGWVAVEHRLTLLSRDRRALPTYRALGVDLEDMAR